MSGLAVDPADVVTILRCDQGRRATKQVRATAAGIEVNGYDAGIWFAVETAAAPDIEALSTLLDGVSLDTLAFVIRAEPLPGVNLKRCRRWLHKQRNGARPNFREVRRRWVLLDFDSVHANVWWDWRDGPLSALHLRSLLPREFHGVSFWWQFTSGAGLKPGLRMRLGFVLSRALTGKELKRWLDGAPVDNAVFSPVQAIYTARPVLRAVPDPVPERSGLEWGVRDVVEVPELRTPELVKPPAVVAAENMERLRSVPATRHGWQYGVLEDIGQTIASTPPAGRNRWNGGGRHHALYCGALRLSRLVLEGHLSRSTVEDVLVEAAVKAGMDSEPDEVARTIRNGFRTGGLPA